VGHQKLARLDFQGSVPTIYEALAFFNGNNTTYFVSAPDFLTDFKLNIPPIQVVPVRVSNIGAVKFVANFIKNDFEASEFRGVTISVTR
jgi:hypothetical protein